MWHVANHHHNKLVTQKAKWELDKTSLQHHATDLSENNHKESTKRIEQQKTMVTEPNTPKNDRKYIVTKSDRQAQEIRPFREEHIRLHKRFF
jgi:hypothetical protein